MKFNRTTTKFAAATLALAVCGTASAAVYRAGLKGGYVNEFDGNNYVSKAIPDLADVFMGPAAATEFTNGKTDKTYPPYWVNNRTWLFHGEMYFDGNTYWFGENIDDAMYVAVDGSQVIKNGQWDDFSSASVQPAEGWHAIVIRMGNGTGGAGYYCKTGNTKDKNGLNTALGVGRSAPSSMNDLVYPEDPGDGSLFRVKVADTYSAFKTITKTASGYTVVAKSLAPARMTMTAYLGTEDGTPQTDGVAVTLDPGAEATYELPWTDESVPFILFSFASVEAEGVTKFWGDALPFKADNAFNSTVSVSAPASIYESDLAQQKFTVSRPQTDAWQEIVVNLAYTGELGDFSALPTSVTLAVGESSKDVTFTMVDNDAATANRTFTIAIAEGDKYVASETAGSAAITVIDDETAAGLCVWNGQGDGTSWEDANNWEGKSVPTVIDTVVFTDAAPANGGSVTVSSAASVKILKFQRLTAMTLTGEGSLRLGGVTRDDLEGNEANQTISVPLKLYPTDGDNCVWEISGSGELILAAASQKDVATVYLYKTGTGTLRFSAANAAPGGILKVLAGSAVTSVANAVTSAVTVGGGETAASFVADGNAVVNGLSPTAYTNGTVRINGDHVSGGPDNFNAHEGGVVYFKSSYCGKYDLWGGTINIGYRGWSGAYGQHITAHQSDLTAKLTGNTVCSDYYAYDVTVENGKQPIDLIFTGAIDGGAAGNTANIKGAGTLQTTSGWGLNCVSRANSLTWLMDNVNAQGELLGSGSGNGSLTVGDNATLGGLGRFGGNNDEQTLTVNGSSGKVATLAPGSITTAGEPVYGTYTVGTEAHPSTLTMGQYSKMLVRFASVQEEGKRLDKNDCLMVNGSMSIASGSTLEIVADPDNMRNIRGGTYVIATVTGEVTGDFTSVVRPEGAKWKVAWRTRTLAAAEGEAPVTVKDLTVSIAGGLAISIR